MVTVVSVVSTVPTTMAVMSPVMLPVMSSAVLPRLGKVRQRNHSEDTGSDSQKYESFESLHGCFLRC